MGIWEVEQRESSYWQQDKTEYCSSIWGISGRHQDLIFGESGQGLLD